MTKEIRINKQLSRPAPASVLTGVARDLLSAVASLGGDPRAIVRAAGLRRLMTLLTGGDRAGDSLSRDDFTRLYAHCIWRLDARAARQEGRAPLTKADFDLVCQCLITCGTLADVIARLDRFSELVGPRLARLRLSIEDGDIVRLEMATERRVRNIASYLSDLTGLAAYHRLFCWLIGEDIPLASANLRYPPMLDPLTVSHLLPYPHHHGASENGFRFPAAYLHRRVVRDSAELDAVLDRIAFDPALPLSTSAPLSQRVSHIWGAMLASGIASMTARSLAAQFSISTATLKRRLAAEGTSLAALKMQARRDLAELLLADLRLPIAEVARRTGFSDAGAFSRAFRGWTGASPSRWRQSVGRSPDAPSLADPVHVRQLPQQPVAAKAWRQQEQQNSEQAHETVRRERRDHEGEEEPEGAEAISGIAQVEQAMQPSRAAPGALG